MQEHPFAFGDAQFARDLDRGHHDRGGLVDEGVGVQEARIRKPDPAVFVIDRHQLPTGATFAAGGQRIGGRHAREPGHQFADDRHVLLDGAPARAADRVLEQRIHRDRGAHVVLVFVIVPAAPGVTDQFRLAARVFGPGHRQVGPLDPVLGAQRLAAAQQGAAHLAARNRFGEFIDQVLRHVAATVRIDVPAGLQPQPVRNAARRIGRGAQTGGEAV